MDQIQKLVRHAQADIKAGHIHYKEVPRNIFLFNRTDHFNRCDFRFQREHRQVPVKERTARRNRLQILPELHSVLLQPVQSAVCIHFRDILHNKAC